MREAGHVLRQAWLRDLRWNRTRVLALHQRNGGNRRVKRGSHGRGSRSPWGRQSLGLEAAASWPVFECLVSPSWRDTKGLTQILVAKTSPFGGVVACVFLVDPGCLGLKDGFVTQFRTKPEYSRRLRAEMMSRHPMVTAEFPLVAKILRESIRYASGLGFEPPSDAHDALRALGPLDAAAECEVEVPVGGDDGKPFYMAGPEDDVERIMNTLVRKCGRGNFQYFAPEGLVSQDFPG